MCLVLLGLGGGGGGGLLLQGVEKGPSLTPGGWAWWHTPWMGMQVVHACSFCFLLCWQGSGVGLGIEWAAAIGYQDWETGVGAVAMCPPPATPPPPAGPHPPTSPKNHPPTPVQMGGTVFDLEEAELCYAPQYGEARRPRSHLPTWQLPGICRHLLPGRLLPPCHACHMSLPPWHTHAHCASDRCCADRGGCVDAWPTSLRRQRP